MLYPTSVNKVIHDKQLKINLNWYNLNFILMPKNTTKPMANRKSGKSGKATRSKSVTGQTKAGIVFGTGRI